MLSLRVIGVYWNLLCTLECSGYSAQHLHNFSPLDDVALIFFGSVESLIKVNEADKLSHFFHALQAENCGARQDIFLKLP